jgi:hypothetical protein
MKTKWGNARLNSYGYYVISSRKEGNRGKLLHRLIWEDMFGPIPEGHVIHHIDGNPINNTLFNLKLMSSSDHSSLHQKGKKQSEETLKKRSEALKGRSRSEETKRKISMGLKGKKQSEETKRKISKSMKGNRMNAKLSERQVRSIKYLLRNLTHRGAYGEIAKVYGVDSSTIGLIKRDKIWKNVKIRE